MYILLRMTMVYENEYDDYGNSCILSNEFIMSPPEIVVLLTCLFVYLLLQCCYDCAALGWIRCHTCLGRGFTRCISCCGSGRLWKMDAHGRRHVDSCWHCHGTGRKRSDTLINHICALNHSLLAMGVFRGVYGFKTPK